MDIDMRAHIHTHTHTRARTHTHMDTDSVQQIHRRSTDQRKSSTPLEFLECFRKGVHRDIIGGKLVHHNISGGKVVSHKKNALAVASWYSGRGYTKRHGLAIMIMSNKVLSAYTYQYTQALQGIHVPQGHKATSHPQQRC